VALSADVEYETRGKTTIRKYKAGAADILYKGAIVNVGTDGYLKVAADVASEVCVGVMKKQHVSDGSTHEEVEVEVGEIKLAHSGAAVGDVGADFFATGDDTLADSATNVARCGECVDFETGYLWINFFKSST